MLKRIMEMAGKVRGKAAPKTAAKKAVAPKAAKAPLKKPATPVAAKAAKAPAAAKTTPPPSTPKGAKGAGKTVAVQAQIVIPAAKPVKLTKAQARAAAREEMRANMCRELSCELISTSGKYCRLHYLKNWKKIKRKELIMREKKLDSYIEELVSKYPEKYIEAIRQDLASERDFSKVISELEIEEFGSEEYDAEAESVIEDVIESGAPTKRGGDYDEDDDFSGGF
jgi:hypothetical protein